MTVADSYTLEEEDKLLEIARTTLQAVTQGQAVPKVELDMLPPRLNEERACFVTLRYHDTGDLRGCTGTLAARHPLALEVGLTTRQTAFNDPRFTPVHSDEVPYLHLEISVLTPMQPFPYETPLDLVNRLRPGIDGVTLAYNEHRATFLPQVWERVADPAVFLDMLCHKMGLPANTWRKVKIEVYTYQCVVIEEPRNFPA